MHCINCNLNNATLSTEINYDYEYCQYFKQQLNLTSKVGTFEDLIKHCNNCVVWNENFA